MAKTDSAKRHITNLARTRAGFAAAACLRRTKDEAPRKSGALGDSVQLVPGASSGNRISFRIIATADHAAPVDSGSKPHVIRVRNARVLAFDVGGETRFAKSVNHPGNPPANWFSKPMPERWQQALQERFA